MSNTPNYNGRKALKVCTNVLTNEWRPATAGDVDAIEVEIYSEAAGLLLGRATLGPDNPTVVVTGIAVDPSELLPEAEPTADAGELMDDSGTGEPIEIFAVTSWLVYFALIHYRVTTGFRGRRAAIVAILGFGLIVVSLAVLRFSTGFHGL